MSGHPISVRLTDDDVARLDAILELAEGGTRGALVREAMRLGLARIERWPSTIERLVLDARGGAREGAGRRPATRRKKRNT